MFKEQSIIVCASAFVCVYTKDNKSTMMQEKCEHDDDAFHLLGILLCSVGDVFVISTVILESLLSLSLPFLFSFSFSFCVCVDNSAYSHYYITIINERNYCCCCRVAKSGRRLYRGDDDDDE